MIIGINGNEANVAERVGSNQYAWQLLHQLEALADKRIQFSIYLKQPPLSDMPQQGKDWRYRVFGPTQLWTQLALPVRLALEKRKPDVFFTPGHYGPRWAPMPSVVTVLDLAFLYYPTSFRRRDLHQLKAWTKYSVKQANKVIAISRSTKTDVVKFYNLSPKKVKVIYPGLIKLPRAKSKLVFKPPYLLYVGTLQPRKNIIHLIRAFGRLKDFKGKLIITGKKGWLYDSIFNSVKELKLIKRVIFTGFVTDDKLATLIKRAELVINPSLYEGFGLPVLQAMVLGTPVLVSRCSSLPEIVGQAGSYIDDPTSVDSIKKGIIKALKTGGAKIGLARQRAEQFSWQSAAEQTLKVLKEAGRK